MVKLCQHIFLSLVLLIYAAHPVVAQENTGVAIEESAGFWSQFVDQDDGLQDQDWREGYFDN